MPADLHALHLTVEYASVGALKFNEQNPRAHKPPQVAAIAKSIRTFGFNVPVLLDGDDAIIAGHGRVAAALKLGLAQVPVIRIEHLSPDQRKAYMIADNRLTDISRWDERLLGEVLRDLTVAELDFDVEAMGFSVAGIDLKIDALDEPAGEDDLVPPGVDGPAVTAPGDLWQLGRHRLLCGSALESEAWRLLMAGEKAAMCFTDPPYNVAVQGHVSGLGSVQHREFAMASGEMDRDEFTEFLSASFRLIAANSTAGSIHFVCIDWRHLGEMIAAGEGAYTELKNVCVWAKSSPVMGSLYRSQHELVFVWKHGRGRHRNNVALGRYGRNRTNVWSYPSIGAFRHSEDSDLLADHPTVKPVKLVADAILDVSARGDIVVDPFMGSGTTLIAAERVGRVAYGLEIDPHYCDTIIRRFEALTGDRAVHLTEGISFGEMAERRTAAEQVA
ncbi:MAG TPA: DNA methyltransferase [Allosphingosinicella sp.]|jgi:DNA modification methylase